MFLPKLTFLVLFSAILSVLFIYLINYFVFEMVVFCLYCIVSRWAYCLVNLYARITVIKKWDTSFLCEWGTLTLTLNSKSVLLSSPPNTKPWWQEMSCLLYWVQGYDVATVCIQPQKLIECEVNRLYKNTFFLVSDMICEAIRTFFRVYCGAGSCISNEIQPDWSEFQQSNIWIVFKFLEYNLQRLALQ